ITLPANPRIAYVTFSPDSRHLAFAQHSNNALELWIADVATGKANKIANVSLNSTTGNPFEWMPDSTALLCRTVPKTRVGEPKVSEVPTGPKIQETSGEKSTIATYQDLLKNRYDEGLFKYYFTAELARVDLSGKVTPIGQPAIFDETDVSPDGRFIYVARIV